MADWWIKFSVPTVEGDVYAGGGIKETPPHGDVANRVAGADRIVVPEEGGRTLSTLTPRRRRELGWYRWVKDPREDEELDDLGVATYTIRGDDAVQAWPNRRPKSRQTVEREQMRRLRNECKLAILRPVVFMGEAFVGNEDLMLRLGVIAGLPDGVYRVPKPDGGTVAMLRAEAMQLAGRLMAQANAAEGIYETKRAEILALVDVAELRNYDVNTGF